MTKTEALATANAVYASRCVAVEDLCVIAEQLVPPPNASAHVQRKLRRLLERTRSPFDVHTPLHPRARPALLAARNALNAELAPYLSTGLAAAPFVLGDWAEPTKTAEAAAAGGALAAPPGAASTVAARLAVPG